MLRECNNAVKPESVTDERDEQLPCQNQTAP